MRTLRVADTVFPVQMTPIQLSASGDNVVLTPTAGSALRIVKLAFMCSPANTVTIKQSSSPLSGPMPFGDKGGLFIDGDAWPIRFQRDATLTLNLASSGSVVGFVMWYEEP